MVSYGFWPTGVSWLFYLVPAIAVYVFSGFALRALAKKTDAPNGWMAWLPLANVYLTAKISGVPLWFAWSVYFTFFIFIFSTFDFAAGSIVGLGQYGMTATDSLLSLFLIGTIVLSPVGVLFSMFFMLLLAYAFFDLSGTFDISGGILPLISLAVYVVILQAYAFLWCRIARARQKPDWTAVLMLIPVVNLVVMGVIAWKD